MNRKDQAILQKIMRQLDTCLANPRPPRINPRTGNEIHQRIPVTLADGVYIRKCVETVLAAEECMDDFKNQLDKRVEKP